MRRIFLLYICVGLLFLGHFGLLGALELEVLPMINNFSFDPSKKEAYTTETEFKSPLFPKSIYGNISLRGEMSKSMGFSINIERDNIMLNSINTKFSARSEYVFVEFGPFFAMSDTFKKLDVGIMGTIEFAFPGVAFLSAGGSSTVASHLKFTSDNIHESLEAKFGLWMPPFIIVTASYYMKSFIIEEDITRKDSLTRVQGSIEFYGKNSPFRLRLDGGYQTLSRDYGNDSSTDDEIKGYFTGLEMNIQASQEWRLILGGEVPFLLQTELTMPSEFWRLFKAKAGFAYTFH